MGPGLVDSIIGRSSRRTIHREDGSDDGGVGLCGTGAPDVAHDETCPPAGNEDAADQAIGVCPSFAVRPTSVAVRASSTSSQRHCCREEASQGGSEVEGKEGQGGGIWQMGELRTLLYDKDKLKKN